MKNPFTHHPNENGMSYLKHLLFALGTASAGGWIWGVSIVHAFFPFMFKTAASKEIESLHKAMTSRHKKK